MKSFFPSPHPFPSLFFSSCRELSPRLPHVGEEAQQLRNFFPKPLAFFPAPDRKTEQDRQWFKASARASSWSDLAADIFLWRDKKISGGLLGVATTIWMLFELLEYHLLSLVCHILILALAVLFLCMMQLVGRQKNIIQMKHNHFSAVPTRFLDFSSWFFVLHPRASCSDLARFLHCAAELGSFPGRTPASHHLVTLNFCL